MHASSSSLALTITHVTSYMLVSIMHLQVIH